MSIELQCEARQAAPRDNPKLAIAAILAACAALSLGDALIKQQSANFVLWQIFLMRSLIALPFLVYFARLQSCATPIKPLALGWTLMRSLLLVAMWILYFIALPNIELAIAAAAYYTSPLFITLFAALFLDEPVRVRGWFAIALGFGGTLLILEPQADDFNTYALLPVLAAICYAAAMILTRTKCRHERPTVLSLWLNLCFAGVGALALILLQLWAPAEQARSTNPFLLGAWTPMWIDEWRIMALLAVAIVIGSIGAAIAYQNGPAPVIATFDFSYVALAAAWGFLIFAELPSASATFGICLIVAAGTLASWQKPVREHLHTDSSAEAGK